MSNNDTKLFERALDLIPSGSQTNAKRYDPSMGSALPHFIDRADGCRIYDVDGREYIDYRSALGPIILGYNHPAVQTAVMEQLQKGVLFSMSSPIELELAERLVALIPGLEQVRYLKSGNEVNHVAIRLARAYTGRDTIVTCGYHGHGDWFSCGEGKSMPWSWPREGNGVPEALDRYVFRVPYGDIDALETVFSERGHEIAGMMTVAYDWNENVAHDFVKRARELTSQHGAALIFDQILTGFRLGLAGAQEYFGVIPDLTTYGKAIANGFPLAVVGGKREFMKMFEKCMITTTHAGETLSIAAGLATLKVLEEEPVLEHITAVGTRLQEGFDFLAAAAGLDARSYGLPMAVQFRFADNPDTDGVARQNFFKALLSEGIFPSSPFLMNYAHSDADVAATLAAMERVLDTSLVELRA